MVQAESVPILYLLSKVKFPTLSKALYGSRFPHFKNPLLSSAFSSDSCLKTPFVSACLASLAAFFIPPRSVD